MKNIVILISGNGSNLQAIINACQKKKINGTILAVFSNKVNVFGLERAHNANIPTHILQTNQFNSREAFDHKLIEKIDSYSPDLIGLAGYMRILTTSFVNHYTGRILNIHPSLLPKYPGLHTHRAILKNRERIHGASVHFVTKDIDCGPIILQSKVQVFSGESEDKIAHRVQAQEYIIYPLAIAWFIDGRLTMNNGSVWLDGIKLPSQGYQFNK